MGIVTVGDLHQFDQPQLIARFGKWGTRLWELARGIDESPVEPSRKRKSWSSENTFSTDVTRDEAAGWIREQAHKIFASLEERSMRARTVTVKLRTPDFKTQTRQLSAPGLLASGDEVARIGVELLEKFDFPANARFRLVGVGVSNFLDEEEEEEPVEDAEPTLFAEKG
jgi:DNA polymerase IV